MAFYCTDCRLIFPENLPNCPHCGGHIFTGEVPAVSQNEEPFRLSDFTRSGRRSRSNPVESVISESEITLRELQEAYFRQHGSEQHSEEPLFAPAHDPHDAAHAAVSNTIPEDDSAGGYDYFSIQQDAASPANVIPVVEPIPEEVFDDLNNFSNDIDRRIAETENFQRQVNRSRIRQAILNFLSNTNPRTIWHFIVFVLIVVMLVVVWNMRYVILNSFLNFIVALLPFVFAIWILWYIIKGIFH